MSVSFSASESASTVYASLAVANQRLTQSSTHVTVDAVDPEPGRATRNPIVEVLRKRGLHWGRPKGVELYRGIERVVRAKRSSNISVGQTGLIDRELFERLRIEEYRQSPIDLQLSGGEVAQVLIKIVGVDDGPSSGFYVLHVRHTEGDRTLRDAWLVAKWPVRRASARTDVQPVRSHIG